MPSDPEPQYQLLQGCAGFSALLIALLAFGFDPVGRFCMFAGPGLVVATALRRGRFSFLFWRRDLIRSSHPGGFWSMVVVGTLCAGMGLWRFGESLVNHLPS